LRETSKDELLNKSLDLILSESEDENVAFTSQKKKKNYNRHLGSKKPSEVLDISP
jgi:hypothetical protein